MSEHTPGTFSQGRTLPTSVTKRWTKEQFDKNEECEKRMVFSNFSRLDEGRGRRLIATCPTEQDAQLIVEALNSKAQRDELLALVQKFVDYAASGNPFGYPPGSLQEMHAVITKIKENRS